MFRSSTETPLESGCTAPDKVRCDPKEAQNSATMLLTIFDPVTCFKLLGEVLGKALRACSARRRLQQELLLVILQRSKDFFCKLRLCSFCSCAARAARCEVTARRLSNFSGCLWHSNRSSPGAQAQDSRKFRLPVQKFCCDYLSNLGVWPVSRPRVAAA